MTFDELTRHPLPIGVKVRAKIGEDYIIVLQRKAGSDWECVEDKTDGRVGQVANSFADNGTFSAVKSWAADWSIVNEDAVVRGDCDECDGKGRRAAPPFWVSETCPVCKGSGSACSTAAAAPPWRVPATGRSGGPYININMNGMDNDKVLTLRSFELMFKSGAIVPHYIQPAAGGETIEALAVRAIQNANAKGHWKIIWRMGNTYGLEEQ